MPKRTKDYHSWLVRKLADPFRAERYLRQAIDDSPEMFLKALRNVAEACGMSKVAEKAGLNRESLYRTLSSEGNPTLSTLSAVLDALGLKMDIAEKHAIATVPPVSATLARVHAKANTVRISANETKGRAANATFTSNVAATTMTVMVVSGSGLLYEDVPYLDVLVAAAQMDEIQEAAQG